MKLPLSALVLLIAATLALADDASTGRAPTVTAPAHPAIWRVKDADTTVYIFGTIHVLRPDIDWFNGPRRQAFDSSDELVIEMVEPEASTLAKLVASAMSANRKDGRPLVERLPANERDAYLAALVALGLPADAFDHYAPWLAATMLALSPLKKAGFEPARGVESVLVASAANAGIPVSGLETVEQQIGYLNDLPEKAQIQFVVSTLEDAEKVGNLLNSVIDQWAAGDAEALAKELNESMRKSPELAKILYHDRNRRWAAWIADRMKRPGVVMMAVGAGHLAGDGSVQDELARLDLRATRLAE